MLFNQENLVISNEEDGYCWVAKIKGKKVGEIHLADFPDYSSDQSDGDRKVLQNISVEKEHQRKGIATQLLKKALEEYDDLVIDYRQRYSTEDDGNDEDGTFLTDEGKPFIDSCFDKGIIENRHLFKGCSDCISEASSCGY
mmetsp:Transcript_23898/g.35073  ORF Transcript_23898/g.35073 Transcript_23898/m.35073 type:complete len:141 (-) Transcript_23898:115-537(-)